MVYPNPDNDTALHMARLYERSPLLVALFDASDNLRYANSTWRSAFALEPDTTLTWSDLMRRSHATGVGAHIDTDDFEAWLVSTRARRGKQPFRTFEADLCDGRWIYMTETVDEQGWMLSVAFDVSAMRVGERTLRQARDGALRAAQDFDAVYIEHIQQRALRTCDVHVIQINANARIDAPQWIRLTHATNVSGHCAGRAVFSGLQCRPFR